jgi:hypothetical protein
MYFYCDIFCDKRTCSNPSQTANNHFGGKYGKLGVVAQEEAKTVAKLTERHNTDYDVRVSSYESTNEFLGQPSSCCSLPVGGHGSSAAAEHAHD